MEPSVLNVVSIGLSAFAVGFNLCNLIWVFFSPKGIRQDRYDKAGDTDRDGENGYNL